MKKLVFSAIALLAFTATSFAAEGKNEVKKVEVKLEVKAETKVLLPWYCWLLASIKSKAVYNASGSMGAACDEFNCVYNSCLDSVGGVDVGVGIY